MPTRRGNNKGWDKELIERLVEEHYQFLYRYAYRLTGSVHEAEDLTQETYCTAQLRIERLSDVSNSRAWLCRILRNHYLARARRRSIALAGLLDRFDLPEQSGGECDELEVDSEAIQQALLMLPEPYRSAVVLHYMDEMTYREIAELLDAPIGTVMSRLARAKRFLRSLLAKRHRTSAAQGGGR